MGCQGQLEGLTPAGTDPVLEQYECCALHALKCDTNAPSSEEIWAQVYAGLGSVV